MDRVMSDLPNLSLVAVQPASEALHGFKQPADKRRRREKAPVTLEADLAEDESVVDFEGDCPEEQEHLLDVSL